MTYSPSIITPKINFEPPKEENLSTKNKSTDFYAIPKVSLIWRFFCIEINTGGHGPLTFESIGAKFHE